MAIRKHPSRPGVWQIIVSRGTKLKQLVYTFECDQAQALILDKQINSQLKGEKLTIHPTITSALPLYLEYYGTIATESIQNDMASIMRRCLLPWFGKLAAHEITPVLVHQYTAKRLKDKISKRIGKKLVETDRTVTHRTVQKELNYLSAMCRWMYYNGMAQKMPAIPKPPKAKTQPKRVQQPLTLDELNRLIDKTADDKRVLILLMSDAGLRMAEALNLKLADIDAPGGRLTVRGKGGKVIVYPILTKRLLDAITTASSSATGDYLTANPKTGEPYGSIKTMLRLAAKRADITKPVTHHTLRHTYSTLLMESGINTEIRRLLMRHSSLAATQHYTHLSPAFLEQQAGSFSSLIDGENKNTTETLKMNTPRKPARARSSVG